jgi:hypothetical protein
MSLPVTYTFTGAGADHDTSHVYELSLDTSTAAGRQNLATLKAGRGSVLAPDRQDSYAGNRALIDTLVQSSLDDHGRKQFLFVARFVDTSFADTITRVFGFDSGASSTQTWWDVYPPQIRFNATAQNPLHLGNDSVVTGTFGFALDKQSVSDNGFARIEAISLAVLRKPDTLTWDPLTTPSSLTVERVQPWLYGLFPFPVSDTSCRIDDVLWESIDPGGWPGGEYLMGVVVRDEYGEDVFAGVWQGTPSNPWLVHYAPQ